MTGRRLISDEVAELRGFVGPENTRRRQVLRETLDRFGRAHPKNRYHQLAAENLARWRAESREGPEELRVLVLQADWGEATLWLTKKYGECFAVLNMANAYVPGGGYVEGAVAQEENMFRRTDCHFHIREDEYDLVVEPHLRSMTRLPSGESGVERYIPRMTSLLSGEDGVVYLDKVSPRVCIRGPEDRTAPRLGYRWLRDRDVFPFFELRAAAQDLRGGRSFDLADARRRIAAQLDTLRREGVRHAVLGASGCGAFGNPPRLVAEIYAEEIDKRRSDFDVIAFAILFAGYGPDNYTPFAEAFDQGGWLQEIIRRAEICNWCVNWGCTTCGSMDFRTAYLGAAADAAGVTLPTREEGPPRFLRGLAEESRQAVVDAILEGLRDLRVESCHAEAVRLLIMDVEYSGVPVALNDRLAGTPAGDVLASMHAHGRSVAEARREQEERQRLASARRREMATLRAHEHAVRSRANRTDRDQLLASLSGKSVPDRLRWIVTQEGFPLEKVSEEMMSGDLRLTDLSEEDRNALIQLIGHRRGFWGRIRSALEEM